MQTGAVARSRADQATPALEALVDNIEANPGDLIQAHDFDDSCDIAAVLRDLPDGIDEADFVGMLRLALLTECATESYASLISGVGRASDAPWLSRFTERVWAPDEITHHTPYRLMLLSLGFNEAELDREIREVQDKAYRHSGGLTPVHITTYGMIQEYLTDTYHGLIARTLKKTAPLAASAVMRIKRRETLHTCWYRDMTAVLVESNPRFVDEVASEVACFDMPGASLIPELQAQGKRWQELMGIDVDYVLRDLIRLLHEVLGSTKRTGELVLRLAADRNVALGPLSAWHISAGIRRLGGLGHGLIGEALLEKAGLGYLFKRQEGRQDAALRPYQGPVAAVRSLLRSWIRDQMPTPAAVILSS